MSHIVTIKSFLLDRFENELVTLAGNQYLMIADTLCKMMLELQLKDLNKTKTVIISGPTAGGKKSIVYNALYRLTEQQYKSKKRRLSMVIYLHGLYNETEDSIISEICEQSGIINRTNGQTSSSALRELFQQISNEQGYDSFIIIFDQFDKFCTEKNQMFLFSLFEAANQNMVPLLFIMLTTQFDVNDLLIQRVRSRFTPQLFIVPSNYDYESYARQMLSLPENVKSDNAVIQFLSTKYPTIFANSFESNEYSFNEKQRNSWNHTIEELLIEPTFKEAISYFEMTTQNLGDFKIFLCNLVYRLDSENDSLTMTMVQDDLNRLQRNNYLDLISGLSIVDMCMLISMKHHYEITDAEPFSYEILKNRYLKFTAASSLGRQYNETLLKSSFDKLRILGVIKNIGKSESKVRSNFDLSNSGLTLKQLKTIINEYKSLPTDVSQWAKASLV